MTAKSMEAVWTVIGGHRSFSKLTFMLLSELLLIGFCVSFESIQINLMDCDKLFNDKKH